MREREEMLNDNGRNNDMKVLELGQNAVTPTAIYFSIMFTFQFQSCLPF